MQNVTIYIQLRETYFLAAFSFWFISAYSTASNLYFRSSTFSIKPKQHELPRTDGSEAEETVSDVEETAEPMAPEVLVEDEVNLIDADDKDIASETEDVQQCYCS